MMTTTVHAVESAAANVMEHAAQLANEAMITATQKAATWVDVYISPFWDNKVRAWNTLLCRAETLCATLALSPLALCASVGTLLHDPVRKRVVCVTPCCHYSVSLAAETGAELQQRHHRGLCADDLHIRPGELERGHLLHPLARSPRLPFPPSLALQLAILAATAFWFLHMRLSGSISHRMSEAYRKLSDAEKVDWCVRTCAITHALLALCTITSWLSPPESYKEDRLYGMRRGLFARASDPLQVLSFSNCPFAVSQRARIEIFCPRPPRHGAYGRISACGTPCSHPA